MFQRAHELARGFTRPVVTVVKFWNGDIHTSVGSFVVINRAGWIVTAEHVARTRAAFEIHEKEIQEYRDKQKEIEDDPSLNSRARMKRRNKLKADEENEKWITGYLEVWGNLGIELKDRVLYIDQADLAIGRLEPFDPESVPAYPRLPTDPSSLNYGTSLMRMGYPLHPGVEARQTTEGFFELNKETLGFAPFANTGIFTRIYQEQGPAGSRGPIRYIETDSASYVGHSGGSMVDVDGRLWSINIKSAHYRMDDSTLLPDGSFRKQEETAHLGVGVHPEMLQTVLRENNIEFEVA